MPILRAAGMRLALPDAEPLAPGMVLGRDELGVRLRGGAAAAVEQHHLGEVASVHEAVHGLAAGCGLAGHRPSADVAGQLVRLTAPHPLDAEQMDDLAADLEGGGIDHL